MKLDSWEIDRRIDRFKATAKDAGLKLTHQRLEIFKEIASSLDHPDAIRVYNSVKERMPTVSLDTVYRTLWTLNDLGVITALGSSRESVRFDANLDHHHHFVCDKCGMVRDFTNNQFDLVEVHKDIEQFGSVLDTHIEVRGICKDCRK